MKPIIKISSSILLSVICSFSYGQMNQYNYKRELSGINKQWHKIILPNEIFGKISQDLNDLRIFGITKKMDTIEAPYLLRSTIEEISNREVPFKLLNTSHNQKGHYFTFEIPTKVTINQIKLLFEQKNFDWKVKLEGSQDQKEWFTVVENYRILSIKNNLTDFQFTKLTFPNAQYQFFRLFIESKEKPILNRAYISEQTTTKGQYRNYPIYSIYTKKNKLLKKTEIDLDLRMPLRLNQIRLSISNSYDYYRPITIEYTTDSIKTEQGWVDNYNLLTSGTLNSLEKNVFTFNSTTIQKLKIIIDNQNNQPLSIDTIQASGYVNELVARFTEPATYFLAYGNKKAPKPQYDINRFSDKIPNTLTTLELDNEIAIKKVTEAITDPLFENKKWLWAIMALMIIVLGWFTLKMINSPKEEE